MNGARDALEMKQMTFYPQDRVDTEFTSWNYVPTCLEDLGATDMFGRRGFRTPSRSAMPDDSFARIPLRTSIKFGGNSFSELYIGSNGYVTFGSGDTRYDNAVSAHYDMPRISIGFMDLDPSRNRGMIRYQISSEYVIVWYNNVPMRFNSRQTLQAQIRWVHNSWLLSYSRLRVTQRMQRRPICVSVVTACHPRGPRYTHIRLMGPPQTWSPLAFFERARELIGERAGDSSMFLQLPTAFSFTCSSPSTC
jgi:hypothetical protein